MSNDIRLYVSHTVNEDNFYHNSPGRPIQLPPDFETDLMIAGLGESSDVEIQRFYGHEAGHFSGVVILKDTTATEDALEELKALWWVWWVD